ncbi:MAG TPA: DedA family protein [Pirellulales bacterium]|jgi:membrane protein DedA with SNARE-associated domain|nr:DedA family protein [Pirellulales bacterium]
MFQDPASYGYLGITVFLILTGCGLPLPEEVAIIAAGVAAARGVLDPWGALAACLVGAIAGDSAMYLIGRRFGAGILERHPYWARLFNANREKQIERLLKKHGAKMILLTRFLVGLRSPVYFAAGVLRVPYLRFLITDICCAISVISLFFGLTYFYGKQIWNGIRHVEVVITVAVVSAIVAAIVIFWINRRGKAMIQEESSGENPDVPAKAQKSEVGSQNE